MYICFYRRYIYNLLKTNLRMESWKTYLVMYFGTDNGIGPSEIAKRIESLGFKTTLGSVDFIYDWNAKPTKEQILTLGDKVAKVLKESGAVFNLDTHD